MLLALSPKEMQVLSWLARGYTNKTIADVLSRGTKAVERQVRSTPRCTWAMARTPEWDQHWST